MILKSQEQKLNQGHYSPFAGSGEGKKKNNIERKIAHLMVSADRGTKAG